MKSGYVYFFLLLALTACDLRSKNRKAADEMVARLPETTNMNVGKAEYRLLIPNGWTTDHRTVYGIDYYYLFAPKTADDDNTSINVISESMQNLPLDQYRAKAIEYITKAIPSASNFVLGELTANGVQGLWYSYTMEPQGIKAALVSYIFPKNGVAYQITAGTAMKDSSRYRGLFDSVARSFKFIELVPIERKAP